MSESKSEREAALEKAQATMRRLQHEVRTPLGQIMGYSELIEEELEDREQEDLIPDLQKIRKAAKRLLDLVDGKLRTETDEGAPVLPPAEEGDEPVPEPIEADTSEQDGDEGAVGMGADVAGARLLVVDDDPQNRDLLTRRLVKQGFEVDQARDGIEGLRQIEAGDYALVLLDVMMPGMNGLEVLERVRRTRSRAELPIILATALDDTGDVVEGLQRGANDYVGKPFNFPVVIARVQTQLAAHRSTREVAKLGKQLEFRNAFIRQALGRDVSDDLIVEMAETPEALDLAGTTKRITALVADVRGSRQMSRDLAPQEFVKALSTCMGSLAEIVAQYDGNVDVFLGDSLVALFGLPKPAEDDAERAVVCGIAMQLEMDEINESLARAQLPELEIGVGIATGDVVVGGFGAGDKLRYKAIGETLATATLIEAAARGQEVWICDETHREIEELVQIDHTRELPDDAHVSTHRVLGVGGSHLISLRVVPEISA